MLTLDLLRVLLIIAHLVAFAVALFLVMREDLRLLQAKHLDLTELMATARLVSLALAGLFVTGAAVVVVDTGLDPAEMLSRPKLLAKFSVVSVLTLNGLVMHHKLFPLIAGRQPVDATILSRLATATAAISSTSWFYATFLGVAKPLTEALGYQGFMVVYASLLVVAIPGALILVGPHCERLIRESLASSGRDVSGPPARQPVAKFGQTGAVDVGKGDPDGTVA